MTDHEHHLQDAAELYAVYRLQWLAESAGVAISSTSDALHSDFLDYLSQRGIAVADFRGGDFPEYCANVDKHIPFFLERLVAHFPGRKFEFSNVEVEMRRQKLKGDILVAFDDGRSFAVSLKNYRASAARPQLSSGTFNSFLLNFVFPSGGVGTHIHPETGARFRGSNSAIRNRALEAAGHGALVAAFEQLDELNSNMRSRFLDSDEFEFLDEAAFDSARKEVGNAGAEVTLRALKLIDPQIVRERILQMIGLDGVEEVLMFDQSRYADSITVDGFHSLLSDVQNPNTALVFDRLGQGIEFRFENGTQAVLKLHVPFTINKNGAWISGPAYAGTRFHKKEKTELAHGQRRPKKSRELATSINTWVDFESTGIFIKR